MTPPRHRFARVLRLAVVAWLAVSTAACVNSTEPILSDGRAILGERVQVHLYEIGEGATRNHRVHAFAWAGGHYAARGTPSEVIAFTVHAYEGRELIVQARTRRRLRPYFYALARRLADGVYLLTAIDPNDADETTRARFCVTTREAPCRVETPEQLFVFARASAAKDSDQGTLAVLVRSPRR